MKRIALTVLLAAALPLAGCGSDKKDDGGPKGPEVAWAGKVCDSVNQSAAQLRLPAVNADAKVYKKNVVTFLGDVDARLESMEIGLTKVGTPPASVSGGQASVQRTLARLRATRASLAQARTRLAKAKVSDQASLRRELTSLNKIMVASATYKGPAQDLQKANPALDKAFDSAASCAKQKA
ncbi:hypothetical protein [Actinomadura parmotrematis]|uniref:Lipoprotein n=1 Tax=Actinomadura parmotrematis TaxID=2864039 RepID=A0ABS7FP07_9ACTN|nr:hypothetical protein [Actinomadura parmotrematis]MBW8482120.1 hypothetical protein [Actinomadura parmotrematis]